VGGSPTRRTLQPEATGAVMEVTKWLKPRRAPRAGRQAHRRWRDCRRNEPSLMAACGSRCDASRLSIGRSIRAWRTLCGRQMTRNARRAYAMPWVVRESTPIPGRFSRGSRAVWADSNSARPPCPPFVVSLTEPLGASQAAFAPSADPRNASQRARRGRASVFGLSPKGKPQSADRLGAQRACHRPPSAARHSTCKRTR
jgi:hypothetical protein